MLYLIDVALLVIGIAAIVLPWVGLKRTGRDAYRVLGILASLACGWCCLGIIASWFFRVMPSYIFLAIPVFFLIGIVSWFLGGAHAHKKSA